MNQLRVFSVEAWSRTGILFFVINNNNCLRILKGVVLLFTEESALAVDDLLETGWNTYHAGFKYVHEKSGQGLRPAYPGPATRSDNLRASWDECARRAGYVRVDEYCSRSRTIYPFTPVDGHNPSISVNHFFIPAPLAHRIGVSAQSSSKRR